MRHKISTQVWWDIYETRNRGVVPVKSKVLEGVQSGISGRVSAMVHMIEMEFWVRRLRR